MKTIFYTGIMVILYTYIGYFLILCALNYLKNYLFKRTPNHKDYSPYHSKLSIIVAVFNEEKNIAKRINNLFTTIRTINQGDEVEIIVASDGSTDRSVAIAKSFNGVKVLDFPERQGKASIHNLAVAAASGDLLLFTDGETEFAPDVIKHMLAEFADPETGCVVGNLIYRNLNTGIAASERLYMKWEKKIRELESNLGLLATGSGACLAVRKKLWRPLDRSDDSDFITPLDVILQGYKVVFCPKAIAYDRPATTSWEEFTNRIRQTSKNFLGTLKRWGLRGWLYHPLISWALVSHKFLRWLTCYLLLLIFVSNCLLLQEGTLYQLAFIGQILFYLLAAAGLLAEWYGKRIPLVSLIYSFCVANLGMAFGVIRALLGRAPAIFRT